MKNLSKEDEYFQQLLQELGSEKPSAGFHKSIVKSLTQKKPFVVYKPVISPLAWRIIGGVISAIIIGVLLFLPSESDTVSLFHQVSLPQIHIPFPKISIPIIALSPIVFQSVIVFIVLTILMVIITFKKWRVL